MVLSDDMKTPQGIVEGTAATFCNSWKTNLRCQDKEERLDDPCSLSVENGNKHWVIIIMYSTVYFLKWVCSFSLTVDHFRSETFFCSSSLRELRQTLVCLATKSKQQLCTVPFSGGSWDILQGTAKPFSCFCLSFKKLWWDHNSLKVFSVFCSDVFMLAVTVRKARPACVPSSPPTEEPVLQMECSWQTGERVCAVRIYFNYVVVKLSYDFWS